MPKDCLSPIAAEKLRKAFKSGEIRIGALFTAKSSKDRVDMLRKYVGEAAELAVAKLEKAYLSPNQKLAMRNWIFKNVAQAKPLYKELSLDDSAKLAENIDIKSLRDMTPEQRVAELSKYVSEDAAESLSKRYDQLKKSNNLANWEERTLGTDKLRKDKKLKGSLAKLEALDDLGVLNPKQLDNFMQTFVQDELGVNVSLEESQKISELVNDQRDVYDKIVDKNDWTADNAKEVEDYFDKRKALEDYTESLLPVGKSDVVNNFVDYFRASILSSPRILRNSFLYQIIPGVERAITKRIVTGAFSNDDLQSNIIEKLQAKLSGVTPDPKSMEFVKRQVAMATRIYHKTGYDISRMETLDAGYKYFGERVSNVKGKGFKESEGVLGKIGGAAVDVAKFVSLGPKWLAGGTDMLFANIGRADTAIMMSKEIASMEARKGKLPEGMTEKERADQLLKESYSFAPVDPRADAIRDAGILDAHMMNNTQPGWWSDKVIEFRKMMKFGKVNFGKAIIPFAKIANVTIAEGVKTASGIGVARSIIEINKAGAETDGGEKIKKMRKSVTDLVRYVGLMGATLLISSLLDDDDYIGGYNIIGKKRYGLAKAKNAGASYIRIAGKWVPIRYLPMINIPIAGIMTARQAKARGDSFGAGYLSGVLGAILDAPGIKETSTIIQQAKWSLSAKNMKEAASDLGLDYEKLSDWAKVRMIPSVLSYDLYNAIFPKEIRYDFMGREVEGGGAFRDDASNEITREFDRLDRKNELPTLSDFRGDDAKELEQKLGEEEYQKVLSSFKKLYAARVLEIIKDGEYKSLSPKEQRKQIDKIRDYEIVGRIKEENRQK